MGWSREVGAGPDGPGFDREGGGRGSSCCLQAHAKRVLSFPLPLTPLPARTSPSFRKGVLAPFAHLFQAGPISGSLLDWKMLLERAFPGRHTPQESAEKVRPSPPRAARRRATAACSCPTERGPPSREWRGPSPREPRAAEKLVRIGASESRRQRGWRCGRPFSAVSRQSSKTDSITSEAGGQGRALQSPFGSVALS